MPETNTLTSLPGGMTAGDYVPVVRPSTAPFLFQFVPAAVAISGSYADLASKPLIPTTLGQLLNDAGFVTSVGLPGASTVAPLAPGVAAAGVSLFYARQDHVHPSDVTRAPLASPVLTGTPQAPTAVLGTNTVQIATTQFVAAAVTASTTGVSTFNARGGAVTLSSSDVTAALTFTPYNATNPSAYITAAALPGPASVAPLGDGTAAVGTSLLYTRQDHVHPFDASRAPIASPLFTGTPQAPTATAGTATIQLATTQFVTSAVSAATTGVSAFNTRTGAITLSSGDVTTALTFTPYNATNPSAFITASSLPGAATIVSPVNGTAAVGTSAAYARQDHVHATDPTLAPLAGPVFSGTPQAPTATAGTSTLQIATTAFVGSAVAASTTGVSAFNTRTGSVTLLSGDVTTALTFTPYNATNPSGYVVSSALPQPAVTLPVVDGVAAIGVGTLYSRQDHVHPTDGTRYAASNPSGYQSASNVAATLGPYALLAGPVFTGTPQAPTATAGTSTVQLATTAFVSAAVGAIASGVATFNTRAGAVTLTSGDVTGALTFTPYNATNPSAFITASSLPGPALVVPVMDGTAALGTSTLYARQDHAHPADTSRLAVGALAAPGPIGATTPGTGNFTTLTLTTDLAILQGGTGAGTAAAALTNLGAYAATNPSGYITAASFAAPGAIGNTTPGPGSFSTLTAQTNFTIGSDTLAASAGTAINAAAGQVKQITFNTASKTRWTFGSNGTAESGANAGADFAIANWTDAGAFIGSPLLISRATGVVTLGSALPVASGGTGGTTAVAARTALALNLTNASVQWTGGTIVTNGTYYITVYSPFSGTINSMDYFTGNGSFTAAIQIGGVPVGGLSAVAVSSATQSNTPATSAFTFAAGQIISVVVTAAAGSPTGAVLSLRITKT